jgi:hypothetical protein
MKTLLNRTVYQCEYCTTRRFTKNAATRHERYCKRNPNNQHRCFDCRHLLRTTEEAGVGENGQLITAKRTVFHCGRFDKDLYSYVAERQNILHHVGAAERMPLTCAGHEEDMSYLQPPYHSPEATDPNEPAF